MPLTISPASTKLLISCDVSVRSGPSSGIQFLQTVFYTATDIFYDGSNVQRLSPSDGWTVWTLSDAGDNVGVQTHHLTITCHGLDSDVIRTTIYRPVIAVLCIAPLLYRRLSVCLMKVRIGPIRRKKWEVLCLLGDCQSHRDREVLLRIQNSIMCAQWLIRCNEQRHFLEHNFKTE